MLRAEELLPAAPVQVCRPTRSVRLLAMDRADEDERHQVDEMGQPAPIVQPIVAPDADGQLRETTTRERTMPRGVYDRSKAKPRGKAGGETTTTTAATESKPRRKRRAARRAPPLKRSGGGVPRFGVFEDGSVQVNTEGCKGNLQPDEARDLVDFINRLEAAGK